MNLCVAIQRRRRCSGSWRAVAALTATLARFVVDLKYFPTECRRQSPDTKKEFGLQSLSMENQEVLALCGFHGEPLEPFTRRPESQSKVATSSALPTCFGSFGP